MCERPFNIVSLYPKPSIPQPQLLRPNIFEIKLKNLNFQDRFDILLKIRFSGVAEPFDKLRTGRNMQGYMGNPGLSMFTFNPLIADQIS